MSGKTASPTFSRQPGPVKFRTRAALAAALLFGTVHASAERVTCLRVIDGDTIVVTAGGKGQRRTDIVRLAGIDAPELRTPAGPAARDFLRALIEHRRITLTGTRRDKYRRRLATLSLPDGRNVSTLLLQSGHARN